jgi:dTDP-4-amino-4,6-dideoxygalactose transaminase
MIRKINHIASIFFNLTKKPFFGFIHGHRYLSSENLKLIESKIGLESEDVIHDFESQFAKLIGEGKSVSYAAARMGFYELMRYLEIDSDDEIIILGATCSVMVNSILKIGARPVFSDIDPDTYGSSSLEIEKKINGKTKLIIAQHSFGIPCEINKIAKLADERQIFLLEDCALTLGSKIDGVKVGNFGNAALFSTDHTKPINTLVGGLIYSKNNDLIDSLKKSQLKIPALSKSRQLALFRRIRLESNYCIPKNYSRMGLSELYEVIRKKIFPKYKDFLDEDYGVDTMNSYPYPSRLPTFLAVIGILEISRWKETLNHRKDLLEKLIKLFSSEDLSIILPKCYTNSRLEIIPLRFAFHSKLSEETIINLNSFMNTDSIWFREPIVATSLPLESFNYLKGDCPHSERIGPQMINIPCNIPIESHEELIAKVKICFS